MHFITHLRSTIVFIALASAHAVAWAAPGDLTVTPTRVIFEGRDRATQVFLVNRGEETATFRISFIQMRMDEHGQMQEIQTPNERERFADRMIRYSPRQVELKPNEGQTIRLLLRKPADLDPGEYRSHLLFYAVPKESAGKDVERELGESGKGFSVAIQPVFRISIPVVVRHGELPVQFSMSELAYESGETPQISLRMDRHGQRSVYGDVNVYFTPAAGGEKILLKYVKDFVLYTSNDTRYLKMTAEPPSDVVIGNGTLSAVYSETVEGETTVLAEQSVRLP